MSEASESEISGSESSLYSEISANESKPKTSNGKTSKSASTKRKKKSASSSSSKPTSKRKKGEEVQKYKSAAMIEDSDEEDYALDGKGYVVTKVATTTKTPDSGVDAKDLGSDEEVAAEPAQKKRKVDSKSASKPTASSSSKDAVKPRPSATKRESKTPSAKKPAKESDEGDPSSAEVVVQKSSSKTKTKKAADPPARKGKKAELSKDEETIKQLKSFVVACGQRKVWSKEFKDIADDPSAQIRRLKQLLAELGMSGRMSMAKAKEIKKKRDMAQELEDVQSFHDNIVAPPAGKRATRGQTTKKAPVAVESSDESDEDGGSYGQPRRKAKNAHQSIMAFLGDQSDDDD
ncbi:hypothetical protein BDV98DRAFT_604162 [Pterulicium gracile]|uniref:Uncharacterized protein n=1 Tax=Pterulicium gracile TaxID=1884261 RepID=A0A5C3QJN9_9AGAR|nr:hypothetical protein BDV98DRAFT_604162 [Pterula gracilis]